MRALMAPGHTRNRRSGLSGSVATRSPIAMSSAFAFAIALCSFLGIVLLFGPAVSPTSAAPTGNEQIQLSGTVQAEVDSLTGQADLVQAQIEELDIELERRTESYNQLSVRLDQLNVRMSELRRQLRDAEVEHARRLDKFEDRICTMYKAGGRDQLLQMLMLAEGVEDLFSRIRLVATLAEQDQRMVKDLQESKQELDALLQQIDEHKREQLVVRRQLADARGEVQAKLLERQEALEGLDSQIAALIEQERERQFEEQERLSQALQYVLTGQQYAGPIPESDDPVKSQLIQTAMTYLGIPYVWAGDRPSTGFDCSGFTQYVFAQHGVYLPHYSGYQAQMGYPVELNDLQPGDLVAFGSPVHHVGIFLGDDLFIHAPRTGDVIRIAHLSDRKDLAAVRRFGIQLRVGVPWVG